MKGLEQVREPQRMSDGDEIKWDLRVEKNIGRTEKWKGGGTGKK